MVARFTSEYTSLQDGRPGILPSMTDQPHRIDTQPTDEPDGTTAFQASLQPPGHSVQSGEVSDDRADLAQEDEEANASDTDEPGPDEVDRAGYDVQSVTGDSPNYRPE